jgi:hypothetical protein
VLVFITTLALETEMIYVINLPSLVRTYDSGEGRGAFSLGILTLGGSGRGSAGGEEAGSMSQGETLSGRGILAGLSQRTYKKKG